MSRLVSILLIVSILVCPLLCGNGIVPCCVAFSPSQPSDSSTAQRPSVVESIPETCSCCEKHLSSQPLCTDDQTLCCDDPCTEEDHGNCPSDNSDNPCQGVCGGAIFGKPPEPQGEVLCLLPTLHFVGEFASSQTLCPSREDGLILFGGNYGCCLRTLYASFLC